MSFADMNVMQLKKALRQTGVQTMGTKKIDLIEALEAEGVTYDYYAETFLADDSAKPLSAEDLSAPNEKEVTSVKAVDTRVPEAKQQSGGGKTVLRLVTGWAVLQTAWGTASQAAPFMLVNDSDVKDATASGDFVVATPEEVKKAYGLS